MKCERCGYEENVPSWVLFKLAECSNDSDLTCDCLKCSKGTMYVKNKHNAKKCNF